MITRCFVVSGIAVLTGCGLVIGLSPPSFDAPADAGLDVQAVDVPSTPTEDGALPTVGPRCAGLARTCGSGNDGDCCAIGTVQGGTFKRSYDAVANTDANHDATVASFVLDAYEVTTGRFRGFVADYPASLPKAGSGKNPNNADDPGWDAAWNAEMPPDATTLLADMARCGSTWSLAATEQRPINCITWFEAYAFCIWDSGRLPTEAEWNYAASAGDEQRVYPWSMPPSDTTIDAVHAVYSVPKPAGVGSARGQGKYGQWDLAGNVNEWVLDRANNAYVTPCSNCADLRTGSVDARVVRGGSFASPASELMSAFRKAAEPAVRYAASGVRCARDAR
jgi:formylglycine-generating enzyme required for sulfatase activity